MNDLKKFFEKADQYSDEEVGLAVMLYVDLETGNKDDFFKNISKLAKAENVDDKSVIFALTKTFADKVAGTNEE